MHHDEHSQNEKKPVAFTVPFILASVAVVIILLFLSLCDPKPHHGKCECKEDCSKECMEACERGEHKMHHGAGMDAAHKMNCGECKSECNEKCMDACMKGDHSKHNKAMSEPVMEKQMADTSAVTTPVN
jgi:hypothetical protein